MSTMYGSSTPSVIPRRISAVRIVLRDKGLGEELVPWEDEVLEFICCCCCAATAVGVSITLMNVLVITIIATANRMAAAKANRFLIGVTVGLFIKFISMHEGNVPLVLR